MSPYVAGWALVLEFIFTLAMALRCYPLQPGGLLALEASCIGMTSAERVYEETWQRLRRDPAARCSWSRASTSCSELLLYVFTKVLLRVRSKADCSSLLFCVLAARAVGVPRCADGDGGVIAVA